MKRLLLSLLIAMTGLAAHAQESQTTTATASAAAPTTPTRTWNFFAHYEKRLKAIEADVDSLPENTTDVIVLLGDSITEGFKIDSLCGHRVVNMGISGDKIAMTTGGGVLRRLDLVKQANPHYIFLLIGINDFGSSKPLAEAQEQYTELVKEIKKQMPEARLIVQALLPTAGRFAMHLPNVNEMNKFLQKLTKENQVGYLDLFKLMKNEKGELKDEFSREGLHLKQAAYDAWKGELEKIFGCGKAQ